MNNSYDDIINLPYPRNLKRRRMSMRDRAAQFAAFAALTGYDEQVDEAARLTDAQSHLSEQEIFELNDRLRILADCISQKPEAQFTYFVPDSKKQGGSYTTVQGNVRRIDEIQRVITLTDGTNLDFERICKIDGDIF